MSNLLLFKLIT